MRGENRGVTKARRRLGCSICRNKAVSRCLVAEGSRDKSSGQRRAERAEQRLKDEQMRILMDVLLHLVLVHAPSSCPASDRDGRQAALRFQPLRAPACTCAVPIRARGETLACPENRLSVQGPLLCFQSFAGKFKSVSCVANGNHRWLLLPFLPL